MRRRPGALLPLEVSVLSTAIALAKAGTEQFYGFELAKRLRDADGSRALIAHGTLYKALSRMEKAGLLRSVWEDPAVAEDAGRPRRRLYSITSEGRATLARVRSEAEASTRFEPGWSPS